MNTRGSRIAVSVSIAAVALAALAGCSAPQPVKTVTASPSPAVTVTVTATASPAPDDQLTSLGAWTVCYGFLTRYASQTDTAFVIPQLRTYDPQWVTQSADGLQVQISRANQPGDWSCTVTGTAGAPRIVSWTTNN